MTEMWRTIAARLSDLGRRVSRLEHTEYGAGGGGTALTVEEQDGTPSVSDVARIRVTNGTLTDEGSGVAKLDFGSAATDGSAIHDNEAGEIHAVTEKATPADDDELLIEDSADSWAKKRVKVSNVVVGNLLTLEWEDTEQTKQIGQNYNGSNNFSLGTVLLYLFRPLKITGIYWDLRQTGTYDLFISAGPTSTVVQSIIEGQVVAAAGTILFDLSDDPLQLLPGIYFLSCRRTTGASTWWLYSTSAPVANELFYLDPEYWRDGTKVTNYILPVGLRAYPGLVKGG